MKLPFRRLGQRIEGDPEFQYQIHKIMSRVWLIGMIVVIPVVVLAPVFWAKVGILLVAELSLYANWATDNGAAAAANASTPDNITEYAIEAAVEEGIKKAELDDESLRVVSTDPDCHHRGDCAGHPPVWFLVVSDEVPARGTICEQGGSR